MKDHPQFSEMIRMVEFSRYLSEPTEGYALGYLTEDCIVLPESAKIIPVDFASVIGVIADNSVCPPTFKPGPHENGRGVETTERVAVSQSCFRIHTCPLVTRWRWFGFRKERHRLLKTYYFSCPDEKARSRWLKAIQNILKGKSREYQSAPSRRRLKIFINPMSGQKQGRKIFARIRPILDHSDLEYSVTETGHAGQIQLTLSQIDLSAIDEIVLVGGDGSMHEAINGLMSRTDWQQAILKPIGVIPAGTGSGLAKTLLEIAGEPYDAVSAAFLIAKGKQRPLDLALVQQNEQSYYSFLSLGWAIISDVDIESERLRNLGSLRMDIYALLRIWQLRHYAARFSYIPVIDELTVAGTCERFAKRSSYLQPGGYENRSENPSSRKLIQSSQNEWHLIEDDFVLFWAMNIPYASHDILAAPFAHLADGNLDVILVRRGISKLNLLLAFLKSAHGEHVFLPRVEYYKVSCFRLEPLTSRGILAVDGERVDYAPIQMEVKRGLARVICG
ncbi:Diacylglycerol kinase [Thiorhodovibrio winogradskyi]|uniref:Diacylglycerol kinase n=1 Tax=Thiorhodovibrio winogradskyi TaxID=77007 RepID=A0ABZ0SDT4_9GAMM|nr:diacylglycerol kinase family protein [Thiorhodovibrio winogradskyi]